MANGTTSETREYDGRGRLLTTIDSYTGRIDDEYDLIGNRTRMTDPDNGVLTYAYDAGNRLTKFTDPEGRTTAYTYDEMSRVLSTALLNDTQTVNEYDAINTPLPDVHHLRQGRGARLLCLHLRCGGQQADHDRGGRRRDQLPV